MGPGWKEWVAGNLSFPLSVFICFLAIMMLCCTFLLGRFASLQSLLELFQVRTTGQQVTASCPHSLLRSSPLPGTQLLRSRFLPAAFLQLLLSCNCGKWLRCTFLWKDQTCSTLLINMKILVIGILLGHRVLTRHI